MNAMANAATVDSMNMDEQYGQSDPGATEIDPGETFLAVTTLYPLFTGNLGKLDASERRAMVRFDKDLIGLAKSVCAGERIPSEEAKDWAYSTILDTLSAGVTEDQVEAIQHATEDADAGLAAANALQRAVEFLNARLPRVLYRDQAQTVNLEPGRADMFEFMDLFQLICTPLSIYRYIADGSLVPTQVEALNAVYPSLLNAVRLSIDSEIARQLAAHRSYSLPAYAEFGVGVLRDDPVQADSWQDAYSLDAARRDTAPSPSQARSPLAQEAQSASERALSRSVGGR